jgi:hypothetical protein
MRATSGNGNPLTGGTTHCRTRRSGQWAYHHEMTAFTHRVIKAGSAATGHPRLLPERRCARSEAVVRSGTGVYLQTGTGGQSYGATPRGVHGEPQRNRQRPPFDHATACETRTVGKGLADPTTRQQAWAARRYRRNRNHSRSSHEEPPKAAVRYRRWTGSRLAGKGKPTFG